MIVQQRILLILHSTAIGGMEALCLDVCTEFASRGLLVQAIMPAGDTFDSLDVKFAHNGVRVHRMNLFSMSRREQLRSQLSFLKLCREFRPDTIHLHTGGVTGGLSLVSLARAATGARVVVTEHEVPEGRKPSLHYVDREVRHWLARIALDRLSHRVVAVSRRNATLRRQWHDPGEGKFASVLNGVPCNDVTRDVREDNRERIRAEQGIDPASTVIGTICRLASNKGLDDLLKAFAIVSQEAECHLLMVGDGPEARNLTSLAEELGVLHKVRFAGFHSDPAPFLDAMDVFALAVPAGSMSIALLEAMVRGLPPVITFCGPEEAVIPNYSGMCAPPNDPAGLSSALLELVRDPALRCRLGSVAASHTREHFSIQRVADDWLTVYNEGELPDRLRADSLGTAATRPKACVTCDRRNLIHAEDIGSSVDQSRP